MSMLFKNFQDSTHSSLTYKHTGPFSQFSLNMEVTSLLFAVVSVNKPMLPSSKELW